MFKKLSNIKKIVKDYYSPVEYNIEPYMKTVREINKIDLSAYSDIELKQMSNKLKERAIKGAGLDEMLTEAFALAKEASKRVLGMCPFDVQLVTAIAIHRGKIAELQTGEGKTLAAVIAAYLNALTGKGVHILTFNDYLAKRDKEWMGKLYSFLGISCAYVKEGMSTNERQKAYLCDVTYVTAKEAGFDYLRDFLCESKELLVHREFNFAIVDEADSILIDEARIPLVIAGDMPKTNNKAVMLSKLVKSLEPQRDYEIDKYNSNVHLTDQGLIRAEEILSCNNLYEEENLELLASLNCALHAEFLLQKDKDYIVKNGKIEIIDEFTGRIADKRHWPDNLHGAVEAKEGVIAQSKGMIMDSIALQNYLALYPKLSGMTGTAVTAAEELRDFYKLEITAVPTNRPCIRKDQPDIIFTHKEAKYREIIAEIKRANKLGQPVLIGTESVEESEQLAKSLEDEGISCQVLNARNDEQEAKIIANAGALGAVTVSTNMAGRGVDIRLGGENEKDKEAVARLGGLYVISTSRHESRRIDNQLRGRAGRQGDPGESRFYISFEDEVIQKHNMSRLLPAQYLNSHSEHSIESSIVKREIARGQRIVEGYNADIRSQLWRYSYILEQQRRIIHNMRYEVLMDKTPLSLLKEKGGKRYNQLLGKYGEAVLERVEKQLTLYYINKCWADYLDYIAYIREGIHLVVIGRKNPLDEYNKQAVQGFEEMLASIEAEILEKFQTVEITEAGINMEKEGLKGPSSTWTYLMNESPDQFSRMPFLMKALSTKVNGALFTIRSLYDKAVDNKAKVN